MKLLTHTANKIIIFISEKLFKKSVGGLLHQPSGLDM